MGKTARTQYVCQQCGRTAPKPLGRCPQCGAWNSMVAEVVAPASPRAAGRPKARSTPRRLSEVDSAAGDRLTLALGEFSRVLGGGIVPGSVVLIGGDPGIGKSTLLLQMALSVADRRKVLYVSGEESEAQIKARALRLSGGEVGRLPEELYLVTETDLEAILAHIEMMAPDLVGIDSIQTVDFPGARVRQRASGRCQVEEPGGFPGGARDQRGRDCRAARPGAHRRYGALSGGGLISRLPAAPIGEKPLWRHNRGGRLRDAARWNGGGGQPLRGIPGGTGAAHPRVGDCSDHGRNAASARGGPGPHQPDCVWKSTPDC